MSHRILCGTPTTKDPPPFTEADQHVTKITDEELWLPLANMKSGGRTHTGFVEVWPGSRTENFHSEADGGDSTVVGLWSGNLLQSWRREPSRRRKNDRFESDVPHHETQTHRYTGSYQDTRGYCWNEMNPLTLTLLKWHDWTTIAVCIIPIHPGQGKLTNSSGASMAGFQMNGMDAGKGDSLSQNR